MMDGVGADRMVLENSRVLRFSAIFLLYFAQGMPMGLFWFAIPIWLAVNGASVADVGSVTALATLPWSLKLITGFLMDRYTYLPMGRRRAWILASQMVIAAALVAAALAAPSPDNVQLLGVFAFAVNTATAFQDVAVDGLAVDILTDDERARGSGFMFGGQAIGIALATALCGYVLQKIGATAAFFLVATVFVALCAFVATIRERQGEKRLPWSKGTVSPINHAAQAKAWWPILRTTMAALLTTKSLLWVLVLFSTGVMYGGLTGATPIIGANYVGLGTAEISFHKAIAGLIGGVLCMMLGGWLGDKLGAVRAGSLWIVATIPLVCAMFFLESHWDSMMLFAVLIYGWPALNSLRVVALTPISMFLCNPKTAATQFTIYMALANLGISFGAFLLGQSETMGGLRSIFLVVAVALAIALFLLIATSFPQRRATEAVETRGGFQTENLRAYD